MNDDEQPLRIHIAPLMRAPRNMLPRALRDWGRRRVLGPLVRRTPGRRPQWAPVRRTLPLSDQYGWDRGLPVDRYYVEAFLQRNHQHIRGDVLEVQSPLYTYRYGGRRVTRSHIVDVDAANREATVIADLCVFGSLPAAAYDCVLLTQTIQYLGDDVRALENIWQALRPGGALLLTAPCLARIDEQPLRERDFWRYTPAGLERRLVSACTGGDIDVEGPGNVLSCSAYLFGLSVEDMTEDELAASDWRFPIIACARVLKPGVQP